MKSYLVTGAAGFIGSNYLKYLLTRYDDVQVVALDLLTYAGYLGTIADDIDRRIRTIRALELVRTTLDERERQIIIMRYGLGSSPPQTQREVAGTLGISRSYVSRIEKAALEKLRAGL